MTDELSDGWHAPEDRKLMVRALARFSDECSAPQLTPECPYFELTAKGPGCGEQCQDLIARYPQDLDAGEQAVVLGGGLAAMQRRRPRRGPASTDAAYDAGQVVLEDAQKPLGDWRFGALIGSAKDRVFNPTHDREVSAESLIDEIRRRDVDPDTILPLALHDARRIGIFVALHLDRRPEGTELARQITAHIEEWTAVLQEFGGLTHNGDGVTMTPEAAAAIDGWLLSSPAVTLLTDVVPTVAELRLGTGHRRDENLVLEGRWLLDRFTQTYLHDWTRSSLEREWRFQHALRTGCCPSRLMRERPMDVNALARAIAERATSDDDEQAEASQTFSTENFVTVALARLMEGRPAAAVNVFRVLRELQPSDMDNLNNLGFCLIPLDPKESVEILTESTSGTTTPTLTHLNLALAAHLAGDGAEAERLVAATLSAASGKPSTGAYIWRFAEGKLALDWEADLLSYGEYLVEHMEVCEGGCVEPLRSS